MIELEELAVAEKEEPDQQNCDEYPDDVHRVLPFNRCRLGLRSLHACDEPPHEQSHEHPGPPFHWFSLLLF